MKHEIERELKYEIKSEIKKELDRELSGIRADEQQLRKILDMAEKEDNMGEEYGVQKHGAQKYRAQKHEAQKHRTQKYRAEKEHKESGVPKVRLALCIMLLGILAAIPVSASVLKNIRGTVRITEENRELVGKELYTAATEEPAEEEVEDSGEMISIESQYMTNEEAAEQTGGIIQEIGPGEDGNPCLLKSTVITPVPLEESREGEKWNIESLLSNNGDITVFTKENGDGWYLEAGQTLTMQYRIDPSAVASGDVNDGERMSIGYIFDHVFYDYQQHRKAKEFTYTLTALEEGTYYLYNQNCCAGYIYLTEGTIEVGK